MRSGIQYKKKFLARAQDLIYRSVGVTVQSAGTPSAFDQTGAVFGTRICPGEVTHAGNLPIEPTFDNPSKLVDPSADQADNISQRVLI